MTSIRRPTAAWHCRFWWSWRATIAFATRSTPRFRVQPRTKRSGWRTCWPAAATSRASRSSRSSAPTRTPMWRRKDCGRSGRCRRRCRRLGNDRLADDPATNAKKAGQEARSTQRQSSGAGLLACLADCWETPRVGHARPLLRFFLFLLADADLEVQHLGFLVRLVIVTHHGIRQVLIDVRALGQDRHQRETLVAGRAKRPEPLHIRNRHNCNYSNMPAARAAPYCALTGTEVNVTVEPTVRTRNPTPVSAPPTIWN